jgi:hypothetical protein
MARKPPSRRRAPSRRRRSRLTPRRWLPLLALVGVVVLAAVALPKPVRHDVVQQQTTGAAALVSNAAAADAVSSAWFCGGGSALGAKGPAELVLVIANSAATPARATVTLAGDEGEHRTRTERVPARGSIRVQARQLVKARWVAATVEVLGGRAVVSREVSGPDGIDAAPCASTAGTEWHVPSGSTVRGATEVLTVYNPFPDGATVDVSFATDSGPRQPKDLQGLSVPGGSLQVIPVNKTVTDRAQVAATVRARFGRVVVDRVQRYDGSGDPLPAGAAAVVTPPPGGGSTAPDGSAPPVTTPAAPTPPAAPRGLISTPGVPGTSARWLFPGADATDAASGRVAVYNPSGQAAEIDLVLGYEEPGRNGKVEPIQLTVAAHQEQVADLASAPGLAPGVAFSVEVRSLQGVGVVAELLDTSAAPSKVAGASAALGAPVAATRWMVADVSATKAVTTSVVVVNPGRRPAKLSVLEVHDGAQRRLARASIVIPPGDRRSISVDEAVPGSALVVTADHAVVVTTGFDVAQGLGRSAALAQPAADGVERLPTAK